MLSRIRFGAWNQRMATIDTHGGVLAPRISVIPQLYGFDGTFSQEISHVFLSTGQNPLPDDHFLGGAIVEVNHETVKKNASPLTRN
jgi:hypothetical protein